MRTYLLLVLLALPLIISAQSDVDYTDNDLIATEAPKAIGSSVESLATYFIENTNTELEKARAIYTWIAFNIKYDTKLLQAKNIDPKVRNARQQPDLVLKNKRAVCEGYSNLYKALSEACGLEAYFVNGYSKNRKGYVSKVGHAWNAVKIDNEWYLIDATWGAGYVDDNDRFRQKLNNDYFMSDPKIFVQRHYPNDPLFQLLESPAGWKTFDIRGDFDLDTENKRFPVVNDSINHFLQLPIDQQEPARLARILEYNPESGYGYYQATRYYTLQARETFTTYRTEVQALGGRMSNIKKDDISRWETIIDNCESHINTAKSYVTSIKPSSSHYRYAATAKKNIKVYQNNIEQARRQMGQFKEYLNR